MLTNVLPTGTTADTFAPTLSEVSHALAEVDTDWMGTNIPATVIYIVFTERG